MKIISINKNKYGNTYKVFLENDEEYNLSIEQIIKYKIKENSEIDYEKFKEILLEDNKREAFNKALDIISFKDNTTYEIENKLYKKGYSDIIISDVIMKLKEYNFLDDNKYAQNYVNNCLMYKKYGKNKIVYMLKQKGIPSNIINNLIFDNDLEFETAKKLFDKKLLSLDKEDNNKKKEKLYRHLSGKGYSNEIIMKLLKNL